MCTETKMRTWEMNYSHSTFVRELDCLVSLPPTDDNSETTKNIIYAVLQHGFAIQYDEGEHALRVRQCDWDLVRGLIKSQEHRANKKAESEYEDLLRRLPNDRWFAAGEFSIHASKLRVLVRLGLLERRVPPNFADVSRTWDYRKVTTEI